MQICIFIFLHDCIYPQVYSPDYGALSGDPLKFTLNPNLMYGVCFQHYKYNMVTWRPKTIPRIMYEKEDNASHFFYLEVDRSKKCWVESWCYLARLSITNSSTELLNRARSRKTTGLVIASSTIFLLRSAVSLSGQTTPTLLFRPAGQRISCSNTRKLMSNYSSWRNISWLQKPVVSIPATTWSTRSPSLIIVLYKYICNPVVSPARLGTTYISCGERVQLGNIVR